MSASYLITEPHPTVAQNSYTHSGRGGAGNFFRAPATTPSSGVPVKLATPSTPASSGRFYSGRGGAGNAHSAVDRPVLSFSEEIARAEVRAKAAFAHVGRGGAGNIVANDDGSHKSRRDSSSTNGSERSGFWARLSNVGSRN